MASVDRMTQNFFLMTKPASPSCTPPNMPQKGPEDKGLSQAGRCVQLQQWCFPGRTRRKFQTEQPLQLRTILPGSSREQPHPKGLLGARSVGDLGSVQFSQRPLGLQETPRCSAYPSSPAACERACLHPPAPACAQQVLPGPIQSLLAPRAGDALALALLPSLSLTDFLLE